jgi:hypothetical protein
MLYHTNKVKDLAAALQTIRVQLADIRMTGVAEQFLVAFRDHPDLESLELKITFQEAEGLLPMAHGHVKTLLCSLTSVPALALTFEWDALSPEVVGEGSYEMKRDSDAVGELLKLFDRDPDAAVFELARDMDKCFLTHEHGTHLIDVNAI